MGLLNGEKPRVEADRNSDLMLSGITGLASTGFAARTIDVIQAKSTEWGAVASLTGCVAITLAGIAAHRWNLAFDTTASSDEQHHPQSEK